jgi:hypothetical protein
MFAESVPKPVLEQVVRVFPLDAFSEVYVCSSGSFRFEQTIAQASTGVRIVGSDVTLLPCALGTLAASGKSVGFEFVERLAFVERLLSGESDAVRVAALLVACEMGRYTGPSEFAALHLGHYERGFSAYLSRASEKLAGFLGGLRLDGFFPRDPREHAAQAIQRGAAVVGSPALKGSGDAASRFLARNTRWAAPAWNQLDADDVAAWVRELDAAGAAYCVLTQVPVEGLRPAAAFSTTSRRTVHVYARTPSSSYARQAYSLKPFKYDAVQAEDLRPESRVEILPIGAGEMNFLKERYLSKNIAHVPGHLNFLVYVDRKLAGGFIYTRAKHDPTKTLYLLSDFSVSRERRVSKLIALLATCKLTVGIAERKLLIAVQHIVTTAFTDKPISMKYRGIYELTGRGPGHLQYASAVRRQSPQDIYREWYERHASEEGRRPGHAARNARRPRPAS